MRKTNKGRESSRQLSEWAILLLLVGLGSVVLLRTYDFVESSEVPRIGIGEVRWFQLATQPRSDVVEWVEGLPEEGLEVASFSRDLVPIEQAWVTNVLRYACPGSDVQQLNTGHGGATAAGASSLTLTLEPPCDPAFPEFLEPKKESLPVQLLRALGWLLALLLFAGTGRVVLGSCSTEAMSTAEPDGLWGTRIAMEISVGWALATLVAGVFLVGPVPSQYALLLVVLVATVAGFVERPNTAQLIERLGGRRPSTTLGWSALDLLGASIALSAGGLALSRAWRQPLWSWDHHAIWGFKARQLASGVKYFLSQPGYEGTAPDYPLGLPLSWVLGCLGRLPTPWDFHVAWTVLVLMLVALLVYLLRNLSRVAVATTLGMVLASPLVFDLEGVGLAELPLATWSIAGLACAGSSHRRAWLGTGICLTMMAFLKNEGTLLALSLLPVVWILLAGTSVDGALPKGGIERLRTSFRPSMLAVLGSGFGIVGVRLATHFQTGANTSFFRGEALTRLQERLAAPGEVLGPLVDDLLHPSWMGFWFLLPIGAMLSAVAAVQLLRVRGGNAECVVGDKAGAKQVVPSTGIALFLAGLTTLLAYALVYFVTPEDVTMHVWTSWHRIAAPVLLWILVAVCWLYRDLKG